MAAAPSVLQTARTQTCLKHWSAADSTRAAHNKVSNSARMQQSQPLASLVATRRILFCCLPFSHTTVGHSCPPLMPLEPATDTWPILGQISRQPSRVSRSRAHQSVPVRLAAAKRVAYSKRLARSGQLGAIFVLIVVAGTLVESHANTWHGQGSISPECAAPHRARTTSAACNQLTPSDRAPAAPIASRRGEIVSNRKCVLPRSRRQ